MFISKRQVRDFTTLSFTQIDRLEREGRFPKRTRLSEFSNGRVVWLRDEIQRWCEERVARGRTQAP